MKNVTRKSIYTYTDYREFLQAAYQAKKAADATYSYAAFAAKAKLGSPNYLKLIIGGQRNLTIANLHAFAGALGLSPTETHYFESLVLENQSEGAVEKKFYRRRLQQIRKAEAVDGAIHRTRPTNILQENLRPAFLLAVSQRAHADALQFAQTELGLAPPQTETLLAAALAAEQILLQNGVYKLNHRHQMQSDPKALSENQRRYLETSLEEAKQAFQQKYAKKLGKFLSVLMTAPEASLPDLFQDFRSALEKVLVKYEPAVDEARGIYRVQLQVYRMRADQT